MFKVQKFENSTFVPKRFLALDGLRGILAITVMLNHMIGVVTNWSHTRPLVGAYISVIYFFIMSGFVLTHAHKKQERFIYYLLVRLARLWPLHFFTTAVMIMIYYYNSRNGLYVAGDFVFQWTVWLKSILFLHGVTPYTFPLINDPSWSISIEFWASLLIPLIFVKFAPTVRFVLSLFLLFILFVKSKTGFVNFSIFGMFQFILASSSMMLGSALYSLLISRNQKVISKLSFSEVFLWICFAVCLIGIYGQTHNRFDFIYLFSFLPLLLIDFIEKPSSIKKFLTSSVVQFFGFISFPLYLIHSSIIIADAQYRSDNPVLSIMMAAGLAIFVSYLYADFLDPIIYNGLKKKIFLMFSRGKI
jgi:peptidoglycan/LPS O-acetylase OafA/YrhL